MAITLNLTNDEIKEAQSTGPKPLAEGIYSAQIFDAIVKDSKAGNPMYVIDFKITDGQEGIGRKIKSWFVIKADALFSLIALNKAVDFPYPTKDTPAGVFEFAEPDEYLGKLVNLHIVQQPYNTVDDDGNEVVAFQNNVKKVLPYDTDKVSGAEVENVAAGGLFI